MFPGCRCSRVWATTQIERKVMRVLQAAGSRAASPLGGAGFQVTSTVRASADVSSKSSCSSDVPIGYNSAARRRLIGCQQPATYKKLTSFVRHVQSNARYD